MLSFAFLLVFADNSSSAVMRSLDMCAHSLIPSLFPFVSAALFCSNSGVCDIIGTSLEKITKKLWGVSGCAGSAFILGAISGYPVGAECAAKLYTNSSCSKKDAECMAVFCNNAGPAYVIAGIGGALRGSIKEGVIIYISQIVSAVIVGIVFRFAFKKSDDIKEIKNLSSYGKNNSMSLPEAFINSVEGASYAMLRITGFIVFFSVVTAAVELAAMRIFSNPAPLILSLIYGVIEVTAGVSAAAEINGYFGTFITAFIITFSGISVTMQTFSPMKKAGLSMKIYVPGKFCQALICAVLSGISAYFFI